MNIKKINRINKSIPMKILLISLIFFMIFTTCILVFETLFFQKFYTSWKMNTLEKNAQNFESDYNKATNDEAVSKLIVDFQDSNNSRIGILDKNGYLKFASSNDLREQSLNERIIRNALNELLATPGAFVDLKRRRVIDQNKSSKKKLGILY